MYKLNGKVLRPGRPFTTEDGTQYPADWLAQSTREQRVAAGIVEVAQVSSPKYDQRFYWGPENPKDLDQLKEIWIGKQKTAAASLLAQTDWYALRKLDDPDVDYPEEVSEHRRAVRAASNVRTEEINICSTVEELIEVLNSFDAWPERP